MANTIGAYVRKHYEDPYMTTVEAMTAAGYHLVDFPASYGYMKAFGKAVELVGPDHFTSHSYTEFWFEDASAAVQFKLSL